MKLNKIFTMLSLLLLGTWLSASAQFKGGQADGYVKDCFNQTSSKIYAGGQGQGYNKGCYIQSTTNIYAGGSADGADKSCYNQTSTNLYTGGSADGYSKYFYYLWRKYRSYHRNNYTYNYNNIKYIICKIHSYPIHIISC